MNRRKGPPQGWLLILALAAVSAAPVAAQAQKQEKTPQEYEDDEFAPWMHDLRRGETILLGSLPFTLFAVTLGYDTVRYLIHVNELDARRYAPWPFRSTNPVPYTTGENIGVVIGVVTASLAISLADFVIGRIRERAAAVR